MKRYGLPIAALLAAVVCIRLGMWQLERLEVRRTLNAERAARLALPPIVVERNPDFDTFSAFRRAVVAGEFDFARQVVAVGRSYRGVPGVHVVTPLRLSDGSSVLVERGWVPSPDGRSVDLRRYGESKVAHVSGVLLESGPPNGAGLASDLAWPHYVRRATPGALRDAYPYPLLDLVLRRTEEPDSVPQGLRLIPVPELSGGPHLSYAIQWFAFAVIAIVGTGALVLKSRSDRRRQST